MSANKNKPVIVPVILCGGVGARLWPVSREMHPKPFMRMHDGESLLQKSFLRAVRIPEFSEMLVVTNRELYFKIEDDIAEVNHAQTYTSYILEPFGRNTAPAMAMAALEVERKFGGDAQLLILPADHLIADFDGFFTAVERAREMAAKGNIVTFGITPEAPETGYGYIEADGNAVKRFVEKPNLDTAMQYLADGNYYWNSGMFCASAGTLLNELSEFRPDILEACRACLDESQERKGENTSQIELNADSFALVPDDSIDYAVMEKTRHAAVVPCQIGWSDIGDWKSMSETIPADENNNRIHGDAIIHQSTNCTLRSDNRVVAAVGLEDIIVVDTADALLVASKHYSQDVKKIFTELKSRDDDRHRFHQTVFRPWGSYTVLEEGPSFKIKRIEVKPGAKLSLQMHHHRSEHWVVISGTALVTNGEQQLELQANESTFIPAENRHRLENRGTEPLVIIEVQIGIYLGEDDIVRFDDVYGRVAPVA